MSENSCDALEEIVSMVHRGMLFCEGEREVPWLIFCTPEGDTRVLPKAFIATGNPDEFPARPLNRADQIPCQTYTLEEAIRFAGKGTRIQLLPGKYYRPVTISKDHTRKDTPLIINGMGSKTILCGNNQPGKIYPDLPDMQDFAFFKIKNTQGVTIRDLSVQGCWPSFLIAENSRHICIEKLQVEDGRYPIFAGPGCSDFIIDNNYWKQDPTEAIWQDIDWLYTHHTQYAYMNGGFFGSLNFTSGLIFSNNKIEYAFNGLRMTIDSDDVSAFNRNVQVCKNSFSYIRDNAIEPEGHALNWHMYHNRFFNNHAPFSFDNVAGGHWLIYGNIGWFDDQPGRPYQTGRGGKIYKFGKKATTTKDSYIFNNSWYTRSFIIKKSNINHFHHYNNAYQFCDPDSYSEQPCLCIPRKSLTKKFPESGEWPCNLHFDYDISTASFGVLYEPHGQESEGKYDPTFRFKNPQSGDLRLKKSRQAEGKSLNDIFSLPWVGNKTGKQGKHCQVIIGAYQGDELIEGPEFKAYP